ncbi:hypothetical protein ACQRCQ_03255 [Lachnospiraceae bacterium SGI.085]
MTENEEKAVRFIKNIKNHAMVTLDHIAKEEPNVSPLVYKGREKKADTILAMVEELQQYRAIGTPEECHAVMEKQTAKKIKQQQWMYTRCSCGHEFSKHHGDGYYSIPQEQKTKYCPDCGQKLDWSDEDGEID